MSFEPNDDIEHDYFHFRSMLRQWIPTAIEMARQGHWGNAKAALQEIECDECACEGMLEVLAAVATQEAIDITAAVIFEDRYGDLKAPPVVRTELVEVE